MRAKRDAGSVVYQVSMRRVTRRTGRLLGILILSGSILVSLQLHGIHAQSSTYTVTSVVQVGALPPGEEGGAASAL